MLFGMQGVMLWWMKVGERRHSNLVARWHALSPKFFSMNKSVCFKNLQNGLLSSPQQIFKSNTSPFSSHFQASTFTNTGKFMTYHLDLVYPMIVSVPDRPRALCYWIHCWKCFFLQTVLLLICFQCFNLKNQLTEE